MSSRQEEKERRRKEREEAERKAQAAAGRTRRLQIAGGAVLAVAVIAVVVVLIASGSGGDDGGGGNAPASTTASAVELPARTIENLDEAAETAGCTVSSPEIEGSEHTTDTVEYQSNPPTSGEHNPEPAQDGVYDPGNTPSPEHYVHSLEHGRILFQYQQGSPQKTIDTLVAIFNEPVNGSPGYHALVFENNTGMEAPVAATAWGQMVTCPDLSPESIDTLRAFRDLYTDKGPEFVP
jgi:hypothetical protein